MAEWDGEIHGELGRLADDGEKAQCHACGEWFLHLGSHAFHAHGLRADDYRRAFGLTQRTKLGGPAWLEMRSRQAADHLRTVGTSRRQLVKSMTREERRAEQAGADLTRRGHELAKTPPERIRHALQARYGTERGYPAEYLQHVAELFVDELTRGQRGVYRRLGDRMGVDWSTARSRVLIAVRRGLLVWTGADHAPDGHLPSERR